MLRVIIIPFLSAMKSDLMAWSIESGPLFLSVEVSRKKSFDHCYNDSPEKTDERVEQAEEEQADDDEESVRLDASEEITDLCRRKSHENFGTIQGRNGDEVEGRQGDIDMGKGVNNNSGHSKRRQAKEPVNEQGYKSQQNIGENSGR